MKIVKELRPLSTEGLNSKLLELKKELLKLNVQVSGGTHPASPGKVKQTKKNIARINTLLKQKGGLN